MSVECCEMGLTAVTGSYWQCCNQQLKPNIAPGLRLALGKYLVSRDFGGDLNAVHCKIKTGCDSCEPY